MGFNTLVAPQKYIGETEKNLHRQPTIGGDPPSLMPCDRAAAVGQLFFQTARRFSMKLAMPSWPSSLVTPAAITAPA